jgi:hypothetical protein
MSQLLRRSGHARAVLATDAMERTNAEKAALGDVDIIPLRYSGSAFGLQSRPVSIGPYRQKPGLKLKNAIDFIEKPRA